MVSVVIPAHDERNVIGRLLSRLAPDATDESDIEVVVVCNGCTDDTAEVAARFPGVRVLSTSQAGKANALRLGDAAASSFPRIYVDADVELGRGDVLALCRAFDEPGVLVAAPRRSIPRSAASRSVRMYYNVWEELPAVQAGVFGRGVIALSQAGFERVADLPPVMADDLAVSSMFEDQERRIVDDALVVVHPPATWADLMRRRVRAATGSHQVYATGEVASVTDSRTSLSDLLTVVRGRPSTALSVPVFLTAAVLARRRAARAIAAQDYTTWLRDESSRGTEANPDHEVGGQPD
jgi:cellulose synthase/poly-beta-1,6-N-acetylglucosamine synthase-like glycosyltransferase